MTADTAIVNLALCMFAVTVANCLTLYAVVKLFVTGRPIIERQRGPHEDR